MAKVKSKKQAKKIKRRQNPDWSLSSLFTRKHDKGDSISILVTDGNIILTGKELPENYRNIFNILESQLKDFKIEFQPRNSTKKYVLNRPYDPKENREKMRDMLSSSEYGTLPFRRSR